MQSIHLIDIMPSPASIEHRNSTAGALYHQYSVICRRTGNIILKIKKKKHDYYIMMTHALAIWYRKRPNTIFSYTILPFLKIYKLIHSFLHSKIQIFITHCSKHGRWMNWAVMLVFAANSFVNPLLYLFFR